MNTSGSVIDLAIVELAYPSNIAPVALDTTGSVLSTIDQGGRMTVLGAGKTNGRYTYSPSQWNAALPDELQSVEVGRVPVQHCVDQLPGLLDSGHLDGNMICSVSLSRLDKSEELGTACHGDSGGPLIVSRPKEPSTSTTSTTTNLRQHPTSSTTSSTNSTAATTASPNQDILLGVVSVGKQNCNGEATAYTSVSYASAWMCSIMCQDSLGLVAFEDCPDWCYDEENGRYHGEAMSDGNGGSPIFGFTGDSQDGNGGGGTAYGLKEQQGRAHAFIDEDEGNNQITSANGNSINCETEGNLEFLFRSKSKSCRVSQMICVCFSSDWFDDVDQSVSPIFILPRSLHLHVTYSNQIVARKIEPFSGADSAHLHQNQRQGRLRRNLPSWERPLYLFVVRYHHPPRGQ